MDVARRAGVEGGCIGANAGTLSCHRSQLAGGVGYLSDRANLDGACLRVRNGVLALRDGYRCAAHGPALRQSDWLSDSSCGAGLATQPEQPVLAGGQAETGRLNGLTCCWAGLAAIAD